MGKINFKESTVPVTLNDGELIVVDGVTYVGNADNEPVQIGDFGYKEYYATMSQSGTNNPTVVVKNSGSINFISELENISFIRTAIGTYKASITGSASNYIIFTGASGSSVSLSRLTFGFSQGEGGDNVGLFIISTDTDGVKADGLSNIAIKIIKFNA